MAIGEKMKKGLKYISGPIVTFISSLYIQDLTHGRVGATTTGYGFPLPWLEKVMIVYPTNPTKFSLSIEGLLIDTAFWYLTIGISLGLYEWYKAGR